MMFPFMTPYTAIIVTIAAIGDSAAYFLLRICHDVTTIPLVEVNQAIISLVV